MKRIIAAVLIALGTILGAVAVMATPSAATPPNQEGNHQVWVCKYVGQPGDYETLKPGKNPIIVDVAAADAYVGADFADGQNHSLVIDLATDENTGQGERYTGEATCPSSTTTSSPTSTSAPTTTVAPPTTIGEVTTTTEAPTTTQPPSTTQPAPTTTQPSPPSTKPQPPSTTPSVPSTRPSPPATTPASPPKRLAYTGSLTGPMLALALVLLAAGSCLLAWATGSKRPLR